MVALPIHDAVVSKALAANRQVARQEAHDLRDVALANQAFLALVNMQTGYRGRRRQPLGPPEQGGPLVVRLLRAVPTCVTVG